MRSKVNKSEVIAFFDRAAQHWDQTNYEDSGMINTILTNACISAGDTVLDVACGTGILFPYYLSKAVSSVTGVDISPNMVEIARKKYPDPRIRILCNDVLSLPASISCNRCVIFNAFPHLGDPTKVFEVLWGLLESGGTISIAHSMSRERINHMHHKTAASVSCPLMPAEQLVKLMDPWFEIDLVCSNDRMYQITGTKKRSSSNLSKTINFDTKGRLSMKTRMTELLGIQYPIMQGGMQWLGVPELAAAVSNAGGLGTINASCYPDPEEFRAAIRKTKKLTDKPFAINLSLTPETTIGEKTEDNIRIAGEEGVPIIETAGRSPESLRASIQAAGMIHIHKCTSLKHALKAEAVGVDMVTLVGYEGAGHPGPDEIGTLVLINECCRKLKIPVLAAGGIVDGRSMAAMLALGAEGVVLGTRFVACKECWIHDNFKQVIVNATEKSTLTCQRNIKNMCRYYNNAQGRIAWELEKRNASLAETLPIVSGKLGKACYESGDTEGSCFSIGVASAVIEDVLSCKEIIDGMVAEAKEAFARF